MSEPYRLENWQTGVSMACHAERVRLLFGLSRTSVAASLAAILLIAAWLWPTASRGPLLVWLSLMLCNIGALLWMQWRYRAQRPRVEEAPRWEGWFSLKTAAGAFSATCMVAANVAPPEMPVKIPSLAASLRDHSMPAGPGMGTIWS